MEKAKETARAHLLAAQPKPSTVIDEDSFWLRSENASHLRAMLDLAKSDPAIAIEASRLDQHPLLLNCQNGTIDLQSGVLRPHNRDDLLTQLADVEYQPEAEAPRWLNFLKEITDSNAELISYIQRWFGYCLTGSITEHALCLCTGAGSNGKSVLLLTLLNLLGEYGCPAAPNLLLAHRNEPHPTGLADLRGRRVAVLNEVEKGRAFAEGFVKWLTGGDKLKARMMRQDFFEFVPTVKFLVAANDLPSVKGADHGIWRRIHVIPFLVKFDQRAGNCDPDLVEKLRGELRGILAWAVRGCIEWQRIRLAPPAPVISAVEEYRQECDPIQRFLTACTRQDKTAQASGPDLYERYLEWCRGNEESPISKKAFGANLTSRGYQRKTVNGYSVYCGLCLSEVRQGG